MPSKERKHFYAISRGHCCPSIMPSWHDASPMVTGFRGSKHRGFNTLSDARSWLEDNGNDNFHLCQGPLDGDKSVSDEHGGRPGCYVATDGQVAAIFDNYSDVKEYVGGCKNSTQKSYADIKTAEAVLQELKHLDRGDGAGKLDQKSASYGEEGDLAANLAKVSLQSG